MRKKASRHLTGDDGVCPGRCYFIKHMHNMWDGQVHSRSAPMELHRLLVGHVLSDDGCVIFPRGGICGSSLLLFCVCVAGDSGLSADGGSWSHAASTPAACLALLARACRMCALVLHLGLALALAASSKGQALCA